MSNVPVTEDGPKGAKAVCRRIYALAAEHTERYGPKIVNPPDCSKKKEGDRCAEYESTDGTNTVLVIYCDGQNGCTRYYECPVGK
jgi:hypothetical protein